MTISNKTKAMIFSVTVVLVLINYTSAFAQTQITIPDRETIDAITDKTTYQFGDTIHLTISDNNTGTQKDIQTFKDNYAGLEGPCGKEYFGFVFLKGDYTSIRSYDELAATKANAIDVINASPDTAVECIHGHIDNIEHVTIGEKSNSVTLEAINSHGEKISSEGSLISQYEITNVYGQTVRKDITSNQTLEYKETNTLPVGKYTIVAFSMSGQISEPKLIEIISTKNIVFDLNNQVTKSLVHTIIGNSDLASLLSLPAMFGSVIAYGLKKGNKISKTFGFVAIITVITMSGFTTPLSPAFATYNVSSQGVEEHSTSSTFKTASVQMGFEGLATDGGSLQGISVQNNHFVHGFTTGTNYLWDQSVMRVELQSSPAYNSHSCTTQGGSYTCKLPTSVKLAGLYNYWTSKNALGQCPSGWTVSGNDCYLAPTSLTWNTVSLSSSVTRLDAYTYQEIQSNGNLYQNQKYRICSPTCGSYTQIATDTRSYATTTSYYDLTTYGGTKYGVEAVVGECINCDYNGIGTGRFYDGTYGTLTYTINSSGSPVYRPSSTNGSPSEENINICWWNTIGNTGGSNPTITATAKYGTSCGS